MRILLTPAEKEARRLKKNAYQRAWAKRNRDKVNQMQNNSYKRRIEKMTEEELIVYKKQRSQLVMKYRNSSDKNREAYNEYHRRYWHRNK